MVLGPRHARCSGRIAAALLLSLALSPAPASALDTPAPRALVVESDTGSVLYAKADDDRFAPANFAKLMTAAVVFDALAAGEIREDDVYTVSEAAWRAGGAPARVTTMFAAPRSTVTVGDLLRGLVVHYANDAALVLAAGFPGGETAFVRRMNETAARLGMTDSRFVNPTGFAAPGATTSVRDLRRLIDYIRTTHPDRYALYALPEFTWNKIRQTNKTGFLRDTAGVEGLVLAYDADALFGAAVSAVRGGRRMLVLASGFRSSAERDKQVKALLDAAYADFSTVQLFPAGATVGSVRVFGGAAGRVDVTGAGPVAVTLPTRDRDGFRAAIAYEGPIPAPVRAGATVARIEITIDGRLYQTIPLVAARDVPVGGLSDRARDGLSELLFGWW
ncbi:D-alanyl-D-alanine carboxypeptidase DacD precursor [Pleomorphomonas sp. SM30]|uniref:serine-type D-Ala-D-Ala carboxypeptidase n=1 Tax=Oharaeibacter diazotrophicus TaxID=1920512 RepID=A0A4R6RJQ0_9HYPH|nr:D-alanyl-D-alanine carboxypeptidase (penicillin-binding protein 5/6) [Oharaeibacter diazotrophicus]BBE71258.1 D-alanyl-D-alanine carboxypeptidase DacD precursor [Pleomorphomonas sp. SM30]GLS78012.1 D-alanyl-D-alanine carboxypeptidase [Oharaeibacter diazotrophicus]